MTTSVIDDEEDNRPLVTLFGVHQASHSFVLDTTGTPRGFLEETGHTAKVTVLSRMVPNLRHRLPALGQDDTMHDRNQVIELGLG